ncbi:MAG: hypothetical protein A3H94_07740 [Acidobacteria bacterium RIFCSPLOWO2_02_FULL_60_20]|nr:MAG: hypothetical protein A3H94_07740 [Acidobacteria bacterium RIFCSPLOWO2_02_FULL_60_20]
MFRFNNGAEPEYIDSGLATGQPDDRVIRILFEGLTQTDQVTLRPKPGVAESWEISPDHLTYTFHLRKNGFWSDGRPVTAEDFVYSWRRVLDPKTAARYASHLYHLLNGQEFNEGKIQDPTLVGVRALDEYTLEVRLREPVPYFLFLTSFYTLYPVPRQAIEKYGPEWTQPGKIVSNGPFLLVEHRSHDKFVFLRNPNYWNASEVRLSKVIAYAVDDNYTSANLYKSGVIDWVPSNYFPTEYIPYMRARFRDVRTLPFLSIYYYLINTTRPPLDNPLVRRALNLAVDRRAITDELLRGGQLPGAHYVPLGFPDYHSPPGPEFDPQEAARLLAQAGYPNGAGFPPMEIVFNTLENHRKIAEAVQQMWTKYLNIRVTLHNEEWATYLKDMNQLNFDIMRRGWVADYPDPSTFIELMESTNGNNNTGWKNAEYDRLMTLERNEIDPARRMEIMQQAEEIVLRELPVIPIYTYASNNLIKPYVRGFRASPTEQYPIHELWIDYDWRQHPNAGIEDSE